MKFKATIQGQQGISVPSQTLLFHCHNTYYVFALNHHKAMVKYMCGPFCLSLQETLSCISNSFTAHRWDHPGTGQYVCDVLIQMHLAMRQHCVGGTCYALRTWCGGLKGISRGLNG